MTVYECIITKLDAAGVPYERHEHVAVRTSAEASAVRGTSMEEGAKALVLRVRASLPIPSSSSLAHRNARPPLGFGGLARGLAATSPHPSRLSESQAVGFPRRLDSPAAEARGEPSKMEGERQARDRYILAVLAANRMADVGVLQKHLGATKIALASPEEVLRVTGCEVGGVPPFGSCLFTSLQTYCDPSLAQNARITFNAGLRTHSLNMAYADWERVEQPEIVQFAQGR